MYRARAKGPRNRNTNSSAGQNLKHNSITDSPNSTLTETSSVNTSSELDRTTETTFEDANDGTKLCNTDLESTGDDDQLWKTGQRLHRTGPRHKFRKSGHALWKNIQPAANNQRDRLANDSRELHARLETDDTEENLRRIRTGEGSETPR